VSLALRVRAVTALGKLPSRRAADILAGVALLRGISIPARRRAALRWAGLHASTRWGRLKLAAALLANGGRCIAFSSRLGMRGLDEYRERIELRGTEHLDAARRLGGTLVVGLHVGPGQTSAALHAHGYDLTASGAGGRVMWRRSLAGAAPVHRSVRWSESSQERALGLLRLRQLLASGETVVIMADARSGRPAMWASVPGGLMPLRSGWFALRRQTGATTLPALAHLERERQIITIHPPLPPPVADVEEDRARCQAVMSQILGDYARRHPAQAFSLAFQSEPGDRPPGTAASAAASAARTQSEMPTPR
jgi:lauroyl/myristoyl acyltransferase